MRPSRGHVLTVVLALFALAAPTHAQYACEQWVAVATTSDPPKRFGHQLVYDGDRQKVLMFGGESRDALTLPTYLNDLWELDLPTATWTEIPADANVPDARSGHAAAYDAKNKLLVIYGGLGIDPLGPTDDLRRNIAFYDPAAHHWVDALGVIPSGAGVVQAAMAYDPVREVWVAFGGRDDDRAYDSTVVSGRLVHPAHHPAARIAHTMVWSPSLGGIVLYGGQSFDDSQFGAVFGDVWLWDGADWRFLGSGPTRYDQGAAWDARFDKLVLFGGVDDTGATTADVLFRSGDGPTTRHDTTVSPAARGRMGFAWDDAHQLAVMFGGKGGDTIYSGTWTFGGRAPTYTLAPTSRESPPCADDFFDFTPEGIGPFALQWQRVVNGAPVDLHDNARMFGTTTPQLEIDPLRPGDSGFYRVEASNDCGTTPTDPFSVTVQEGAWIDTALGPQRENTQMAYDGTRGTVVLFGGFQSPGEDGFGFATENDTWEYDGSAWARMQKTSVLPDAIPGRQTASMAYDPVRQVTVMYGGFYGDNTHQHDRTLSDTWEWNGATWTQKANGPGPRVKGQMVWDGDRQRIELYGGRTGGSTQANDLWEWDGTTWTPRVTTGGPPTANENATATYDPVRKALVVQTYTTAATPVGETWDLIDGAWTLRGTTSETSLSNGTLVLVFDAARGHPVGIGFHQLQSGTREHETWILESPGSFRRMNVGAFLPPRSFMPLVYDAARQREVTHGGRNLTNGDEILETSELTFEGDPLCGVTACGDGAVDPSEDCDPFSSDDGLCCSQCHFVSYFTPCGGGTGRCDHAGRCVATNCGNGVLDPGEECEPYPSPYDPYRDACCNLECKYDPAGSACYHDPGAGTCDAAHRCVSNTCGDGVQNSDLEECDGFGTVVFCCTPTCRNTIFGACSDACSGGECESNGAGGAACRIEPHDATGCSAATSTNGWIDGATGGTITTPDGSASLTVPPGVAPSGNYAIASHLAVSAFGIGDATTLVLAARFGPSTVFGVPGVTITLHWPDADGDGIVDGTNVAERTLTLRHDGVPIGSCATGAGCSRTLNQWSFHVVSFSELAIVGSPPPLCATFGKPKLRLGKMLAPGGDDTLAFAGVLPAPPIALDADVAGVAFRLDDGVGSVVDVTLPPGAYDKVTKTGWKVDKKRTTWRWSHPKAGAPSGIVKATLAVHARHATLAVSVKGAAGTFAATAPVVVTLDLPATGTCGATHFAVGTEGCRVTSRGKTLACKTGVGRANGSLDRVLRSRGRRRP
ncbi:MAG: hypothetical protein IT294_02570 [Deltaproteobacteria bacterium]|nr:hypothetical protein [Deltaproteobacteria bacterium]